MSIIELAKQAGLLRWGDGWTEPYRWGQTELETFAHLVIAEHLKGVDMEPAIRESIAGNVIAGYTAAQMAAQRQQALDEAKQACLQKHANGNWKHDTREECADAIEELKGK